MGRKVLSLFIGAGTLAALAARADQPASSSPDFDKSIAPLLTQRCLDCHSGPKPKGGLDLSRRAMTQAGGKSGPAIVPGKPDDSVLWGYVDQENMPPNKP